ncbi:MAG: hypothetical protein DMG78_27690 [Acidobacteria bacterium]|nr:MAG: hypothetical protein DMG78_27690 [Acidobacteriota bacterium]
MTVVVPLFAGRVSLNVVAFEPIAPRFLTHAYDVGVKPEQVPVSRTLPPALVEGVAFAVIAHVPEAGGDTLLSHVNTWFGALPVSE